MPAYMSQEVMAMTDVRGNNEDNIETERMKTKTNMAKKIWGEAIYQIQQWTS
jgi:hypothetical protein